VTSQKNCQYAAEDAGITLPEKLFCSIVEGKDVEEILMMLKYRWFSSCGNGV
jgi:hypothetical protein